MVVEFGQLRGLEVFTIMRIDGCALGNACQSKMLKVTQRGSTDYTFSNAT